MAPWESLFTHLALPPKVPSEEDPDIDLIRKSISSHLTSNLNYFYTLLPEDVLRDANVDRTWTSVRRSLDLCIDTRDAELDSGAFIAIVDSLRENPDLWLVFDVAGQNCGLIIRLDDERENVIFETFEVSPSSEAVLRAENSLAHDFPARAAKIPIDDFQNPDFQKSLAGFMVGAINETYHISLAKIRKAGVETVETRNTADPILVMNLLMPMLEEIGCKAVVSVLRKKIRDDVNIVQAGMPWRRLPFYHLLRVALHRQLCQGMGTAAGHAHYKFAMALFLALFLRDGTPHLQLEQIIHLRAKVCRRLAKLETLKQSAESASSGEYHRLFAILEPVFTGIIEQVNRHVDATWESFCRQTRRHIPRLPLRADEASMTFTLPCSGDFLHNTIREFHRTTQEALLQRYSSVYKPVVPAQSGERFDSMTRTYYELARTEDDVQSRSYIGSAEETSSPSPESQCSFVASRINSYLAQVGGAYDSLPGQASMQILTMFSMWMDMDKYACSACPLLKTYPPPFDPQAFDVLQLPDYPSIHCLSRLQDYLTERILAADQNKSNIFHDAPSFADAFVSQNPLLSDMLYQVESCSTAAKNNKILEWSRFCTQYDRHTRGHSEGVCTCTLGRYGDRNVNGCTKCWHFRARRRLSITVHEDFLPRGVEAKHIIFEIAIPKFFSCYRDVTWVLIREFAHPSRPQESQPSVISHCKTENLANKIRLTGKIVSLASPVKSFSQTHYKGRTGQVTQQEVLRPFGPKFALYDHEKRIWIADMKLPFTFEHLCGIKIPPALSDTIVHNTAHPPPVVDGPSSYAIQASQANCPHGVSIHEFTALQTVLGGILRRWPNMLVELNSPNLSFSNKHTTDLFCQLAHQVGPLDGSNGLRQAHIVFSEEPFCLQLVDQIATRLRAITPNWREINCMELLIVLAQKLFQLTTLNKYRYIALQTLQSCRSVVLGWIRSLRVEFRETVESEAADRIVVYAFRSALLARKTLAVYTDFDVLPSRQVLLEFFEASIALSENLVINMAVLTGNSRDAIVDDAKMLYRLLPVVKRSFAVYPEALETAILTFWLAGSEETQRTFDPWISDAVNTSSAWVTSRAEMLDGRFVTQQRVDYDLINGHFLIDGKPFGKLPSEFRESEHVIRLFGNQHLMAYPSAFPGMTYTLSTRVKGHIVHLGAREQEIVIISESRNGMDQYIPPAVFTREGISDFPYDLIHNHFHWLNIGHKVMAFRPADGIWNLDKWAHYWSLNLTSRKVRGRSVSSLVDNNSALVTSIANIFRHFEDREHMTVFQVDKDRLLVELLRLDLIFSVNSRGLLQSKALHAEIDPDQDAGTLYGLDSKLVLRRTKDNQQKHHQQRIVLIPIGKVAWIRHGCHVRSRVMPGKESAFSFCKFNIDTTLGRLSCQPEPVFLYFKALFHALTSSSLPDTLTGRSGTEEAIRTLTSAAAQPWMVMGSFPRVVLEYIQGLSPRREYYPPDKRALQSVVWDDHLTATIQHDAFFDIIDGLKFKSNRLNVFYSDGKAEVQPPTRSHLRQRGLIQRTLLEPGIATIIGVQPGRSRVYKSRDSETDCNSIELHSPKAEREALVKRVVSMVMKPQLELPADPRTCWDVVSQWKIVGGFHSQPHNMNLFYLGQTLERIINEDWGNLVTFCRRCFDPFLTIFSLATLAFASPKESRAIEILVAFYHLQDLRDLEPPNHSSFTDVHMYQAPSIDNLKLWMTPETLRAAKKWKQDEFAMKQDEERLRLARLLVKQWPNQLRLGGFKSTSIDCEAILELAVPHWNSCLRNKELREYVQIVDDILRKFRVPREPVATVVRDNLPRMKVPNPGLDLSGLFTELIRKPWPVCQVPLSSSATSGSLASISSSVQESAHDGMAVSKPSPAVQPTLEELGDILSRFTQSADVLRRSYGNDLKASLDTLRDRKTVGAGSGSRGPLPPTAHRIIDSAAIQAKDQFNFIMESMMSGDSRASWLMSANLWPGRNPLSVLELLRSCANHTFGPNVKENLVSYGVLLTDLQQTLRVQNLILRDDYEKAWEEWRNESHRNWNPFETPDWLLLELDADIIIRREQIEVARAIISPCSRANSVLQMNMGQGKTSCVVPMAIASLANGKDLARLIVPKALLYQTAQTLQSRIGGLVGREVRHIPFSRQTATTSTNLALYRDLHLEILNSRGVLLSSPEHVLSYKLSGLQRLSDNRTDEAESMIGMQSYLTNKCRDVIDESDHTLAVKTQLIYPSGSHIHVDGHPHRWNMAQLLLSLVEEKLPDVLRLFPQGVEVVRRAEGFPMIHILAEDVEDAWCRLIVGDLCQGNRIPLQTKNPLDQFQTKYMVHVLYDKKLDARLFKKVLTYFQDPVSASKCLLLVRGLLLNNILFVCLKKRWNVQYGLHPGRAPVAVPFEAKGVPSDRAEFGHPDVFIILTCLAFYFSGLTRQQFREDLETVLKSEDPATEFDRWSAGGHMLPPELRQWNLVNTDDPVHMEKLWGYLRFQRTVLDHYMNHSVFPVHAKQFTVKIQASAWDLPLFPQLRPGESDASTKGARTTGFSGTNDNKAMLPMTIRQDDLPSLKQTNADVLAMLLEPRNRKCVLEETPGAPRWSEEDLLKRLRRDKIRVLIDAGANILEMDNETLANKWLAIDFRAKAALFFGNDNRPWIIHQGSKSRVPLTVTPFADNLTDVLVYLDEAHTRGVDLKLPPNATGALTLALGQTKDHTVQAAMRLRQLATTQSVCFFAPPEVYQSIRRFYHPQVLPNLESSHVIGWLLEQTCISNHQLGSLYYSQGADFCSRINAEWQTLGSLRCEGKKQRLLDAIQSSEMQTIEQLYGPSTEATTATTSTKITKATNVVRYDVLNQFMDKLRNNRRASNRSLSAVEASTEEEIKASLLQEVEVEAEVSLLQEVEQEREVEFEVEEVREVQTPTKFKAHCFRGLDDEIRRFAETGILDDGARFPHIFTTLQSTQLGLKFETSGQPSSRAFVSHEFLKTIVDRKKKKANSATPDNFFRPVQWILWSPSTETGLVIIPEECEELMPEIRARGQDSRVHLIAYAAPVTKGMTCFNDFSFWTLPPLRYGYRTPSWFSTEIGILAGRLYLSFADCQFLSRYLGEIAEAGSCLFGHAPLNFLAEWLVLRRKTQNISYTPMGYICEGRSLQDDHAFFVKHASSGASTPETPEVHESESSHSVHTSSDSDADSNSGGIHSDDEIDHVYEVETL